MIISLDLDGVLARLVSEFAQFMNLKYNLNLDPKKWRSIEEALNLKRREADKRVFEFYQENGVKKIKPVDGSIEAVKELGAKRARLLRYYTSGDIVNDYDNAVGYAAIIFE